MPDSTGIRPSTLGLGNAGAPYTRDYWSMVFPTGESRQVTHIFLSIRMCGANAVEVGRYVRVSSLGVEYPFGIEARRGSSAGDVLVPADAPKMPLRIE